MRLVRETKAGDQATRHAADKGIKNRIVNIVWVLLLIFQPQVGVGPPDSTTLSGQAPPKCETADHAKSALNHCTSN
eukprot:6484235-Amphidinium_carterae.2